MIKTIYKYVDLHGLECVLKKSTLKFSKAEDFNAPFEFHDALVDRSITIRHWKEIVKSRRPTLSKAQLNEYVDIFKNDNKDFLNEIDKQFQIMKKETRISCFSEINDNILMWSHYADKHKGACIGFNLEGLKSNFDTISNACKVLYTRRLKSKNLSANREDAILHWIRTKSNTWKYEKEYRIVLGSDPEEFQYFDPTLIQEVIFGNNVHEEDKIAIEVLIFEQLKYDWVKTSEMNIAKNKFKLEQAQRK